MRWRRAGVQPRRRARAVLLAAVTVASSGTSAVGQQGPPPTTTSTSSATSTSTSTSTSVVPEPTTGSSEPEPTLSTEPPDRVELIDPGPDPGAAVEEPGPPPPSVSDGAVADFLDSMVRTPANSTLELLAALRPLLDVGFSAEEVALRGFGRFPLAGEAFFRDDFGEFRAGPPVHGHQGTDIWAAFDVPVRAPAAGIVRFEDTGLGGKGAFVTEADRTFYYLAHLSSFATDLDSGDFVQMGQVIGFNGDSGNAKGGPPHVHFEIHPGGGAAVNPKPILDRWLAEALAAAPALLAPYLPGGGGSRPLTALGLARHFDGGLLTGPTRADRATKAGADGADAAAAQQLAGALVSQLTPEGMRNQASPYG